MSVKVESVETLRRYSACGESVPHHGKGVDEVVFTLLGLVLVTWMTPQRFRSAAARAPRAISGSRFTAVGTPSGTSIQTALLTTGRKHTGDVVAKYSNVTPIAQ